MIWPAEIKVPPTPARGRMRAAPHGVEEGELCLRDEGTGRICLGKIELLPDRDLGGCSCPSGNPPCGYCTSSMPECPACGWRDEQ